MDPTYTRGPLLPRRGGNAARWRNTNIRAMRRSDRIDALNVTDAQVEEKVEVPEQFRE